MATDISSLLLALAGFAFAWWAQLHLGRLWSSGVTRKADHRFLGSELGAEAYDAYRGRVPMLVPFLHRRR